MPNFHFIPALSDPQQEDNWQGEIGLITDVVDRYLSEQGDDVAREGYLCGSPGMINACIDVLTKHKITEEKIYYDKFG
ncbi:MAG: Na+-transporting NADH:ubiquinone oxidoreductase, subunit NqrF, partial [Mesotoga prima]